jgi:cytoskeletal protein RodZ
VIESIEADDFVPCGGDFYARGHLRTLARILGVDVAPLIASYDAHHAQAPIDARRVFEAELATASIHGTRGGPNWSVLVAAVMTLVLAWSVARLVMDAPIELRQPAPVLNGSGGLNNGAPQADPVPVVLTADRGVRLMVRDGTGEIAFTGDLAIGQSQRVSVVYPIRVTASDGGAVSVSVAGEDKGEVGEDDTPAEATYVAD